MSQLFKYNGRWVNLEMLRKLKSESSAEQVIEKVKEPFCNSCDSKGVRHKKECPLAKQ